MTIGVVLLHGKWDTPPFAVAALAEPLAGAGCAVRLPTLPWALRRLYDACFDAALDQIADEAAALRHAGCRRVLLCGHSLGACAALATAAQRGGIDGLILLAPGHFPERLAAAGHTAESLHAARAAVTAGRGAQRLPLVDVHQGRVRRLRLRPDHYLGYFSPDGPAAWPANAARLAAPLPMLWLTPHSDTAHAPGIDYAFERAPHHPASNWRGVAAAHHDTPAQAVGPILDWLRTLDW
ncbi:alpha/beta fold hydrolase [Denitromonas iodatirespirans]|uniref:Alpha/beta fold hydrolase n=1 Tax=Denitromonas iodatirespirans TaxID=2795389 RepID=A0A944H8D8_DENI1|nr:alpha/beta fold hydrolase [Denitromonas iodatirespirans]MBT0961285.1 alpha/beta fold hydrolase [Denitromonas iodatirespirans]